MNSKRGFGAIELLLILVVALGLAFYFMKSQRQVQALKISPTRNAPEVNVDAQQVLHDVQADLNAAQAEHEKALQKSINP
jgi:hypothetical protein